MHPKTLKALQGSIKKWELIVAGISRDEGGQNCPLCKRFAQGGDTFDCSRIDVYGGLIEDCPVKEAAGESQCMNTPYDAWCDAHDENGRWTKGEKMHDDDSAIAAVLELEFLRSLLPEK